MNILSDYHSSVPVVLSSILGLFFYSHDVAFSHPLKFTSNARTPTSSSCGKPLTTSIFSHGPLYLHGDYPLAFKATMNILPDYHSSVPVVLSSILGHFFRILTPFKIYFRRSNPYVVAIWKVINYL